jgi:hypothetical protein
MGIERKRVKQKGINESVLPPKIGSPRILLLARRWTMAGKRYKVDGLEWKQSGRATPVYAMLI